MTQPILLLLMSSYSYLVKYSLSTSYEVVRHHPIIFEIFSPVSMPLCSASKNTDHWSCGVNRYVLIYWGENPSFDLASWKCQLLTAYSGYSKSAYLYTNWYCFELKRNVLSIMKPINRKRKYWPIMD